MSTLFKRRELSHLVHWSGHPARKPLVIRGARQVGKSTLVRQFAEQEGLSLLELNFERNPEFLEVFTVRDPSQILSALRVLTGHSASLETSLLFLDEIQAAPQALVALRYFHEEMPALRVIAAGSLLEFALADARFSMPVGRIEYCHLGPLQFEDFAAALGHTELVRYLQALSLADIRKAPLLKPIHEQCLSLLRQYWVVGGMPEAVAQYATNRDFHDVVKVQRSIVATYRDDFNKYSHGTQNRLVQLVFDQLPVMVGRKFKYAQVSREHRAADLEGALQQLCMARIATKVFHTSGNGVPLAAEINPRAFKTLYLDIGLLSAALQLNILDLNKADITLINNGALAEQFIGQQWLHGGAYDETPALHYWMREAVSAAAEVDYVVTHGPQVIPVEIKSGTTGTLKSLHQFLNEKQRHFALRFNADVPSLLQDARKLTAAKSSELSGTQVDYTLLSLPLYLVNQARRLVGEVGW